MPRPLIPTLAAVPLALVLACSTPLEPAASGAGAPPRASVEGLLPAAPTGDPPEDCMHAAGDAPGAPCSDRRGWEFDSPAGEAGAGESAS